MNPALHVSLIGILLLALAPPARGQGDLPVAGGVGVRQMRVHSTLNGGTESLSAPSFGVHGVARLGTFVAKGEYSQANLASSDPGAGGREAVEAELLVGAAPLPWLALSTGPHVRAYTTPFGTQRWLLWELSAHVDVAVVPETGRGYLELRRVVAADVSVREPWGGGWGGEAGLVLAPPAWPVWMRLGYRYERHELGAGARREVVDGVVLAVGIGRLAGRMN